jgi:hypothetical protein
MLSKHLKMALLTTFQRAYSVAASNPVDALRTD